MKIGGTVRDILARKPSHVWTISPSSTVFDAISAMAGHNVGALPVVEGEFLVGMISERDYTRKVVLHGKSSKQTKVAEIMSTQPVRALPEQTVEECMEIMTRLRVRHLPVFEHGRLQGVISIGDLVKWTIQAQGAALDQMERYISGSYYA